jgi:hypothetical protein
MAGLSVTEAVEAAGVITDALAPLIPPAAADLRKAGVTYAVVELDSLGIHYSWTAEVGDTETSGYGDAESIAEAWQRILEECSDE